MKEIKQANENLKPIARNHIIIVLIIAIIIIKLIHKSIAYNLSVLKHDSKTEY